MTMYWLNPEYQAHPHDSREVFPPFPVPRVGPLGWDGDARAGIADDLEDTAGYLPTGRAIAMPIIIPTPPRL
jgi:hypothetical protein